MQTDIQKIYQTTILPLTNSAELQIATLILEDVPRKSADENGLVLAEAAYIIDKGRTSIPTVADLLNDVLADSRIEIYPLTFEILQASLNLTSIPEMHDRLIVATGIYLQNLGETVEILTKDNEIVLASLLPVIWN